jgi:hypothetical protein
VGTVWKVVLIEAFVAEGTLAVPTLEIFAVLVTVKGKIAFSLCLGLNEFYNQ